MMSGLIGSEGASRKAIAAFKILWCFRNGLVSQKMTYSVWKIGIFKIALSNLTCIGIKSFSFEPPAMQDRFGIS